MTRLSHSPIPASLYFFSNFFLFNPFSILFQPLQIPFSVYTFFILFVVMHSFVPYVRMLF